MPEASSAVRRKEPCSAAQPAASRLRVKHHGWKSMKACRPDEPSESAVLHRGAAGSSNLRGKPAQVLRNDRNERAPQSLFLKAQKYCGRAFLQKPGHCKIILVQLLFVRQQSIDGEDEGRCVVVDERNAKGEPVVGGVA